MTAQPTRDQLRALASRAADDGYTGNDNDGHLTVSPAVLTALIDQLDQAEARIKAVEDVLEDLEQQSPDQIGWDAAGLLPVLRRALESVPPPGQ